MHRHGRRNAIGTAVYDQMTTSMHWRQLLVAGHYGIEYSLASASDGSYPHGWGPRWNLGAHVKNEFGHIRFSTSTTAYWQTDRQRAARGRLCVPWDWVHCRLDWFSQHSDQAQSAHTTTTQLTRSSWLLLMLQHYAHSRNRSTATDEKTRKVFSILVVISLAGTILKTVATRCHI